MKFREPIAYSTSAGAVMLLASLGDAMHWRGAAALDRLKVKSGCAVVVFDKKSKAKGLFFESEGDASGIIAASADGDALVVVNVTTAKSDDYSGLIEHLKVPPKPMGTLALGGPTVVFDGGCSGKHISERNPGLASTAGLSALAASGQRIAAGASFILEAGTYHYGVFREVLVPGTVYDALWVWCAP